MRKKYEDGIHDISIDEYHSADGVSRTQLMAFDKSAYHYWYENISGLAEKKEPTDAMIVGSAFHTLLLQPELFKKEYSVFPKIDRRTTKGKEEYKIFFEENKNKIILTIEQYEKVSSIVRLVKFHDIVTNLLSSSKFEQSIFWTDKETGIQFKARPDIWSTNMIVDLKTTKDANHHRFMNSALTYGYYLQAGMMHEACKTIDNPFELFVILAVEKEQPHVPSIFIMNEDSLKFGIEQFSNYKNKLKKCLEMNEWPGYLIHELGLPKFATIDEENE